MQIFDFCQSLIHYYIFYSYSKHKLPVLKGNPFISTAPMIDQPEQM